MSTTHAIGHDRVIMGKHRNGSSSARVVIYLGANSVLFEGTGSSDDMARADLLYKLRMVEHEAGDIADALAAEQTGEGA